MSTTKNDMFEHAKDGDKFDVSGKTLTYRRREGYFAFFEDEAGDTVTHDMDDLRMFNLCKPVTQKS